MFSSRNKLTPDPVRRPECILSILGSRFCLVGGKHRASHRLLKHGEEPVAQKYRSQYRRINLRIVRGRLLPLFCLLPTAFCLLS